MTSRLKLLAALAVAAFVISFLGDASAKTKSIKPKPAKQTEQQPAPPPRQIIPERGVQPLTPEIAQSLKPRDSFKECDRPSAPAPATTCRSVRPGASCRQDASHRAMS